MKKKIVHVIDSLGIGGAEILLRNTVSLLDQYEHIIVFLQEPSDLKASFPTNTKFYFLKYSNNFKILSVILRLRTILKSCRPLLVHSHLIKANFIARLATPISIPLVFSLHSLYSQDTFLKNRKGLWMEKIARRSRHAIIAVSKFVLEDYLQWVSFKGKCFVLYNFLPDEHFKNLHQRNQKSSDIKCVAVGNLKEAKNYHYLLQVFEHLKGQRIRLDIFGDGQIKDELSLYINKHDLPIALMGAVKDVHKLLPAYDFFLQASTHEGYGISVMEAMAIELPVFVSSIPVFREITKGQAHFFELNNAEFAARRLIELSNNPALRYKYVIEARETAICMATEKKYKQKLLHIYNEIQKSSDKNMSKTLSINND